MCNPANRLPKSNKLMLCYVIEHDDNGGGGGGGDDDGKMFDTDRLRQYRQQQSNRHSSRSAASNARINNTIAAIQHSPEYTQK